MPVNRRKDMSICSKVLRTQALQLEVLRYKGVEIDPVGESHFGSLMLLAFLEARCLVR